MQQIRKRAWLLAAVVLLALAAWLMSRGDKSAAETRRPRVEFPRHQRPEEQERSRRRRTLPPAPAASPSDDSYRPKRDPVITALPASKGKSAVVFEASSLKDSPIGQHWLDCMLSAYQLKRLQQFREHYGVDLLEDIDRVAFSSEKVIVVSGDFADANWGTLGRPRVYGGKGAVFDDDTREDRRLGGVGIWNDELILLSPDLAAIEAAMDRLEDRSEPVSPRIPEWAAYGDIYGFLSADDLAMMLPEDQAELAERLRGAVSDVELHVDASEDVAIVADVEGTNPADVEDLSKSLGGALSLARLKAQADGETDLAELLDFARIRPRGGRSSIDLALPLDVLIQKMGPCRRGDDRDGLSDDEKN